MTTRRAEGAARKQAPGVKGRGAVHELVVASIGKWILAGVYAPGDLLPREDDLAEKLGVSRTSVREAIKVLSAKGGCCRRGEGWACAG